MGLTSLTFKDILIVIKLTQHDMKKTLNYYFNFNINILS